MDPLRLNHPMWISDKELDPARHIFRVAVPAPGGMRELEKLVGQIVSIPLDRSVPLWELHVCEGLEGGMVAVVAKLHHALADGNAANNLLANATGRGDTDRRLRDRARADPVAPGAGPRWPSWTR